MPSRLNFPNVDLLWGVSARAASRMREAALCASTRMGSGIECEPNQTATSTHGQPASRATSWQRAENSETMRLHAAGTSIRSPQKATLAADASGPRVHGRLLRETGRTPRPVCAAQPSPATAPATTSATYDANPAIDTSVAASIATA